MKRNTLLLLCRVLPAVLVIVLLAACESAGPLAAPPAPSDRSSGYSSRPGLGTETGYERTSVVTRTEFFRRSSSPEAVASFHYNDEEGAKAMADQLGRSSRHSGLVTVAGGHLKAGLVSTGWRGGDVFPSLEADGKHIFIGKAGQDYAIRMENRTDKRLEIIVSVDGLNVLNGQGASYSQKGYVIAPHQCAVIDGFRMNDRTVKAFRFGTVADSKAAKSGSARNVGVVGLAVFEEDEAKQKAFMRNEQHERGNADAFPAAIP